MLQIDEAARCLRRGHVLAVGTESSFALCALYDNRQALLRLHALKQERHKPVALVAANLQQLASIWAEVPEVVCRHAADFWPGALTLVHNAQPKLSELLTAGSGTIGVRIPAHQALLQLLEVVGPLTATSANPTGAKVAWTEQEVQNYFPDLAVAIEPGLCTQPSTVLDIRAGKARVLRQGALSVPSCFTVL